MFCSHERSVAKFKKKAPSVDCLDPTEQARVIVEVCDGDIREAKSIANINVKFAKSAEIRRFWLQVEVSISARMIFGPPQCQQQRRET